MVDVNPKNLIWARETAGLSVDEAALKLGYKNRQKRSAVERLQAYESGKDAPSHAQLRNMAAVYHLPLLALYLSKPPRKEDRGEDYRTRPENLDPQDNALLDILIRRVKVSQSIVRDLLEDDEHGTVPLVNSALMSMGYEEVSRYLLKSLRFRLEDFRGFRTHTDAFSYLRDLIEASGVFVLLKSDLGSYKTAIPSDVYRGFALSDPIAPFIVVNGRDAKSARPFTALHELTHVCLGSTGISGKLGQGTRQIERFCDRVAGRILLNPGELLEISSIQHDEFEDAVAKISRFARKRHLSHSMVTYNLQMENLITRSFSRQLFHRFEREWAEQQKREKEILKNREGGPDYYKLRRNELGRSLLYLSRRSIDDGELTPSKAAILLGVKPRNVEPLLDLSEALKGA